MTTVFSADVTLNGQAWVDFDVYLPQQRALDLPRRRAAGVPDDLTFAMKPQLAMNQLDRLTAAELPVRWAAFDEVDGRSEALRKKAARAGLAYVAMIPCDYQLTLPSRAGYLRPSGRRPRGVRAPLLRQRIQGAPLQRLGDYRHRDPGDSTC